MNYNKIKELLAEKRLTWMEFAAKVGVSRTGLYKTIENETLSIKTLEKIAEVLEVPVATFYEVKYREMVVKMAEAPDSQTQIVLLKEQLIRLNDKVTDKENILRLFAQREQLVLEMWHYFDQSLTDDEKKVLASNKYYEKFTTYLISCFGMNGWQLEGNEKMFAANKELFETANDSDPKI